MKRSIKGFCLVLLVAVLSFTLTACGEGSREIANKSNYESIGTTVYGTYAQNVVTDAGLIAALEGAAWQNNRATVGLNTYERVVASPYRSGAKFSDGTVIEKGKTYYFTVSGIEWYVLSSANGSSTVLSKYILDVQAYNTNTETDNYGNYPNNWGYSTLRQWLNDEFFNTAFSTFDQTAIDTTKIICTGDYTYYKAHTKAIADTWDKVYCLSYGDVVSKTNKFSEDKNDYDLLRMADVTDYAKAKGAWFFISNNTDEDSENYERDTYLNGNGKYWLRTAGQDIVYAGVVRYTGEAGKPYEYVNDPTMGVRPAVTLGFEI